MGVGNHHNINNEKAENVGGPQGVLNKKGESQNYRVQNQFVFAENTQGPKQDQFKAVLAEWRRRDAEAKHIKLPHLTSENCGGAALVESPCSIVGPKRPKKAQGKLLSIPSTRGGASIQERRPAPLGAGEAVTPPVSRYNKSNNKNNNKNCITEAMQ